MTFKNAFGKSYIFDYSSSNQLVKTQILDAPFGSVLSETNYKYDPLGRRMEKVFVDKANSIKSYTKRFIYDGDNILAESDANNKMTAYYTHSPLAADDVLSIHITGHGITSANGGDAINEASALGTSAGNFYFLKDALGTVTDIMNSDGELKQKYEYSAYGKILSIKDYLGNTVDLTSAPIRSSFSFTGREYEPELGMYYYRARYYDPNTGRFLQQDPDPGKLRDPRTFLSKYAYVGNNPVLFSDPSGRSILSNVFDSIAGAGHDFIANLGAGFDTLIKDKTVQIILVLVAAAFVGPAVAGLLGATGSAAVGISAGVGGIVGGVGFQGLGLGTFEQGFLLGALAGGIAAYSFGNSGLYGNSNPLVKFASSEWNNFVRADKFQYFFNLNHADTGILAGFFGGGFGGPTLGGTLVLGGIKTLIPEKNDEGK